MSWHVRVVSPHVFLMSVAVAVHVAERSMEHMGALAVLAIPVLAFTAFLTAVFAAYVVMSMHGVLGIEPWDCAS